MARRWTNTLTQADVTPEHLWLNRRQILAGAGATGAAALLGSEASAEALEPNSWDEITNYNNYYEFGVGKDDPARNAGGLRALGNEGSDFGGLLHLRALGVALDLCVKR